MKVKLDCLSCIFRQTLEASRMATDDKKVIREIVNEYARLIPDISFDDLNPRIVAKVQNIIKQKTDKLDPYNNFKNENIKMALSCYPEVKKIIEKSKETLKKALIMSGMGNSIDAGVSLEVDIKENIKKAMEKKFIKSDYKIFKEKLANSQDILIIADNAGEAVFDRLLIKEINKYDVNITYAVREEPILNDITLNEARLIKIDKICNLISSGCKTPGIILEETNEKFKKNYKNADIIISKGQGNLEGLLNEKESIFFLLKAKCKLVANLLQVKTGDLVFVLNE